MSGNGRGEVVHMEAIRKVYDTGKVRVEALRGVDLRIGRKEFVAIVGPSGSGKSTLMNLIGCLDTPTSGVYEIGGRAVSGMGKNDLAAIRNQRVGFVFQNFNLLPQISSYENVEMPLVFGRVPKAKRAARVRELLTRVGLGDRMDHKPTELSGGQMQRVAIARALVNKPAIVLADEPTGNLDSASGKAIVSLFAELHAAGQTIVMITHDQAVARLASRVIQIRDGLVVEDRPAAA